MRIAITAQTDQGLQAPVAQHFGHAPYFVVVDVNAAEVSSVEVLANPFLDGHQPGQIPQFIHEQRAEALLTGGMGGRAIQFFDQLGIDTATGASGAVADAVADYLDGRILGAEACSNSVEHGHV